MNDNEDDTKFVVTFGVVLCAVGFVGFYFLNWLHNVMPISNHGEEILGTLVWIDKNPPSLSVVMLLLISFYFAGRAGSLAIGEDEDMLPYPLGLRNALFLACCVLLVFSIFRSTIAEPVFRENGISVFHDFKRQTVPYSDIDRVGVICKSKSKDKPRPVLNLYTGDRIIAKITITEKHLGQLSALDDIFRQENVIFVAETGSKFKQTCVEAYQPQKCPNETRYIKIMHLDELAGIPE